MAGAIAFDLRDGERKMCLLLHSIVAIVRRIRILMFFIRLFMPHRLGCIVLHVVYTKAYSGASLAALPLTRAGGIFARYDKHYISGIPP